MNTVSIVSRRWRRTTPVQRDRWVRRYHQSGLTQGQFARQHGLGLASLRRWIALGSARAPAAAPAFIELPRPAAAPGSSVLPIAWGAEVIRPDGTIWRLSSEVATTVLPPLFGS
jgi:hypothetical protein